MLEQFQGSIVCDPPNDQIYKFDGVIQLPDGHKVPLSHENFLLRGSSLRNTEWAIGVVTHTGHDTRIMRNSVRGRQKFSSLERKVSWSIAHIFAIEAFLCSIAATVYTAWNYNNDAATA